MMHLLKVSYSALLKCGHFNTVRNALGLKLVKSGTHATAWNKKTKEAVTYKWSEDINVGKKFVLILGYEKKKKEKWRQCHAQEKLPCKSIGDVNSGFNYLYTTTLLNKRHLWMDADP
eukprot:14995156-Ditylum_brightwellii.AAC.1